MSTTATTRILHTPMEANAFARHRSWVWPLPRLDGIAPSILRLAACSPSDGIAIGYPGRSLSPSLVPVFAAQDGVVTYAGTAADGSTLCIDHLCGWSTHYAELADLLTRPTDRLRRRRKACIRAGDIIGHACRSSLRIRFGLSRLAEAHDPAAWMPTWSMLPWFGEPTPRVATRAAT